MRIWGRGEDGLGRFGWRRSRGARIRRIWSAATPLAALVHVRHPSLLGVVTPTIDNGAYLTDTRRTDCACGIDCRRGLGPSRDHDTRAGGA